MLLVLCPGVCGLRKFTSSLWGSIFTFKKQDQKYLPWTCNYHPTWLKLYKKKFLWRTEHRKGDMGLKKTGRYHLHQVIMVSIGNVMKSSSLLWDENIRMVLYLHAILPLPTTQIWKASDYFGCRIESWFQEGRGELGQIYWEDLRLRQERFFHRYVQCNE